MKPILYIVIPCYNEQEVLPVTAPEFLKKIEDLTREEITRCAVQGNATAGLCVQKRGGIPAIPTREEVEKQLEEVTA